MLAVALQVDALLNSSPTEYEVATLGPFLEAEPTQEISKIVEWYRGVGVASQDPFEKESRPGHSRIVPRCPEAGVRPNVQVNRRAQRVRLNPVLAGGVVRSGRSGNRLF